MSVHFYEQPHRRYNILTGEWILVSPHRTKRPWQGKVEKLNPTKQPAFDENCYLCPGNTRANGEVNPIYKNTFAFTNDFAALISGDKNETLENGLFIAETESGICKVVCFSPNHSLTLPLMTIDAISNVISLWQDEYSALGALEEINHIQIFENKGATMGCSNPHPHGQIWAQQTIPHEVAKKDSHQLAYWNKNKRSILSDYLAQELDADERIILENEYFVALIPYWAVWPYETIIIPKRHLQHIGRLTDLEKQAFAEIIKELTTKYDNLFETSFPYSAGIHQSPTNGNDNEHWHFHMSFYPPLLRSATVKKFMVGYEMFAGPQRDITAEQAANSLRSLPDVHYTLR
ncbi:UDP-glucose--hexose-1-phosphate uridylyltransferase [Spongiivirga citrea]|uniref:Galactose-1-phosphate uridylyltransferase n=1 Tax=Spongiivirga citrea TaxID=1481457 RepID=A0A6M0CG88_9FLAO|nr:UDP-glucose--hexose-1-phosphate uridylyltransferase [Spongiivirga citrea]NER15903.1 UDP-glucose--hexose-1-phosphate uridylyltransferase [Spongiivirga citrea]